MKISEIQIGKISIPLKKPFKTALRRVDSAEDIIVKVIADTGETGFGNAPPTAVITGDSQDSVVAAIRDTLGPRMLGMDVENLEGIMTSLDSGMLHNHSAKAALDIAVHDLFGKRFGLPLHAFLGGFRKEMETDLTISLNGPEEMVRDSLEAVGAGYTAIKLKVGGDVALDQVGVSAVGGQLVAKLGGDSADCRFLLRLDHGQLLGSLSGFLQAFRVEAIVSRGRKGFCGSSHRGVLLF